MGSLVIGSYIFIAFAICGVLIELISVQRIRKINSIIFILVCLFGAIVFNNIISESYSHYNSYKYLFIFAALYFIFINVTKDMCYKYIVFLTSLCMGYILVILSLPIFNLFRVYIVYSKGNFIIRLIQSFIITTLSFLLCEFVLFIGELFVLEETSKHVRGCVFVKYLIHKGYLASKLFKVKDNSTWIYKLKDIIGYMIGYIFNPKKKKIGTISIIAIITYIIFLLLLIHSLYFHNPTREFRLQFHNNTWHVLIDNTHNKLIKSSNDNYINGYERNIKLLTLSPKSNLKYFNINNNKLYIRSNVLSYPHLGKIDKKSPLIFYGITHGAYHFSGIVNVKKNSHFSSKANINVYLSRRGSQLRMIKHDIRE